MNKNLILIVIALTSIGLYSIWKYKQPNSTNTEMLILLDGASSSGKSAILNAFANNNTDFKIFKIDDFYPSQVLNKAKDLGWDQHKGNEPWEYLVNYVEEKTGHPNFDTQVRAYLFHETSPMYLEAKEALKADQKIIIDTVFEYDPEYEKFTKFFTEFNCLKVLVYCPLDVLLERVQKRNSSGIAGETRTAFQSFEQFPALYKLQEHAHEKVVDTASSHSIKSALDTAIQELIANNIPERYIPLLQDFKQNFINRFKLDELTEIKLVTRHHYDLILNSATHTPEELATIIETHMG